MTSWKWKEKLNCNEVINNIVEQFQLFTQLINAILELGEESRDMNTSWCGSSSKVDPLVSTK